MRKIEGELFGPVEILAYMLAEDATRAKPLIYVGMLWTEGEPKEYESMDALLDEYLVD